jgi:hypothetical protein
MKRGEREYKLISESFRLEFACYYKFTGLRYSSGIRTHDPSVREGEDVRVLDREATLIGSDKQLP